MISKLEMKKKEIQLLIGFSDYNNIVSELVDFINNEFNSRVSIILIKSIEALKIEGIDYRAKVEWENETNFPRTPLRLMIDCINLKGYDFLFAFLHECGHLKNYNNDNIKPKTKRSEISAWIYAYEKLKSTSNFENIEELFFNEVKKSLETYNVNLNDGKEITQINIKDIID